MGQLTNLNTLDISDNQFTKIPESIARLKKLNTLLLSNNLLTTIPEWFGQLTNLNEVNIKNNDLRLSSFPESIGLLKKVDLDDYLIPHYRIAYAKKIIKKNLIYQGYN